MKKMILVLLIGILLVATFTACGGGASSLVGRWERAGSHWRTWEFFSDGTLVLSSPRTIDMDAVGSWTVDDDRLAIAVGVGLYSGAHTFSVSGNTLTIGDWEFVRAR